MHCISKIWIASADFEQLKEMSDKTKLHLTQTLVTSNFSSANIKLSS